MLHAKRYRIYIVDDHPIVRRGLRALISQEPDFVVCGEAQDAAQAFEEVLQLQPHLVITDLALPGRNGLELTKQLRTHFPELPVIVLSLNDEQLFGPRAHAAGASGYIVKDRGDREILRAIRVVLGGEEYFGEPTVQQLRAEVKGNDDRAAELLAELTDREVEVYMLIGQGFPPRQIAAKLSLSVNTVQVYCSRLKDKLGLDSSAQLQRHAIQWTKEQAMSGE